MDDAPRVGSVLMPLENGNAWCLAQAMLDEMYKGESGGVGLVYLRGTWAEWLGGRWVVRDEGEVERAVWRWSHGLWAMGVGAKKATPVEMTALRVRDVVGALRAICEKRGLEGSTGAWVGEQKTDSQWSVGLSDVVVEVGEGGGVRVVPRDETWFDFGVVGVGWDEVQVGECPVWERCLEEWAQGDGEWKKLLQRWFGYCLVGERKLARWLLMEGKIRAGKGVIVGVLEALLGSSVVSVSLDDLNDGFGLDGLESAKVLVVTECNRLGDVEASRAARVLKQVVGGDAMTVRVKYERARRGVRIKAAPILCANLMPKLEDKGMGMSGKMLVLPFMVSFLGKEDIGLAEKLRGELAGIVRWALGGLVALRMERVWGEPVGSHEKRDEFLKENNPMDSFLEERFVWDGSAFMPTEMVWVEWERWREENKEVGGRVSKSRIAVEVVRGTSWALRRGFKKIGGRMVRGVYGLRFKMDEKVGYGV